MYLYYLIQIYCFRASCVSGVSYNAPVPDFLILFPLSFPGRKKKNKGGIMMSGIAVVAMLAQMFLGKIAFLAAAALMLSKIALMFSAVVRTQPILTHEYFHICY